MRFTDYLNHQRAEDRRAFIIHYPAGSGKTRFAQQLTQICADISYLDLLAYYLDHPELPPISKIGISELRALLHSLQAPQPVILVDNSDFLFNTWNTAEKQALLHWLRVELRSPTDTDKTFILVIQDDGVLSAADIRNSYGEPRVLALNDFDAVSSVRS
jgi:ATP/maltotriose-dependent transcriptional regulator MalT